MTDLDGWERQLSELMRVAADEPPRDVSVRMVRRRLIRRRVSIAAAATAVAVVLGGVGAAAAGAVVGRGAMGGQRGPASGGVRAPGVPSYYVQGLRAARLVVRSRTTGAITGTVRCPWGAPGVLSGPIAPAAGRTFFLVCASEVGGVPQSRIYRFRLTVSGHIRGYFPVRGGVLRSLSVTSIAVTPDGATVAVSVSPPKGSGPQSGSVLVIRTKTGSRARWQASTGKPGTIVYPVRDLSLTGDGGEVVFLTRPRCVPSAGAAKCHVGGGEQVRALRVTAAGGQVSDSRLLFKQARLMRIAVGYINAAVVSPDGSMVTVAEVGWPEHFVRIVQVSAVTGRQVGVIYRLRTGNGFSYNAFSADPSGRYFILVAGRARGPVKNGWVYRGRLVRLWPRDGSDVTSEVW